MLTWTKIVPLRTLRITLCPALTCATPSVVTTDHVPRVPWKPSGRTTAPMSLLSRFIACAGVIISSTVTARHLSPASCDLDVFRHHARQAQAAWSQQRPARAAEHAGRALDLVRGEPGEGLWTDPGRWPELVAIEEEVRTLRRTALTARLHTGDHVAVLPEIDSLARAEPTCEWVHELLIRALYLAGRQHDAIATYSTYRSRIADELGLTPGPGMSHTYRMILDHDPALLPAGIGVVHLARGPTATDEPVRRSMAALDRAGDFATSHGGHRHAIDCYRSLLELQTEPAGRAELLLKLGEAFYHGSGSGANELADAAALFAQLGDPQRTAEALSWQARARWLTTPGADEVPVRLERVIDLIDPDAVSPAGAAALTNACGLFAVTGRHRAALRAGRLGLDTARRLSLSPLDLRLRTNLAIVGINTGDPAAVDELAAVLREDRSRYEWIPPAVLVTFADAEDRVGRLASARRHRTAATRAAHSRGNTADLPWLTAEGVLEAFQRGRWAQARRTALEFLAGPERKHRMAAEVHLVLGRIAAGEHDMRAALRHAGNAERLARLDGGSATVGPALALRIRLAARTGQPPRRIAPLVDELLSTIDGSLLTGSFGADLPLALAAAGLCPADLARHRPADSDWVRAADAVLAGDTDLARLRYRRIGSPGDARQVAAAAGAPHPRRRRVIPVPAGRPGRAEVSSDPRSRTGSSNPG